MKSVLGAVKTMHATGMTHRDIKPDNIVLSSNLDQGGYVHRRTLDGKKVIAVLIDFGMAAFPGIYLVPQLHFSRFISKPLEVVAADQEKGKKVLLILTSPHPTHPQNMPSRAAPAVVN